MELMQLRFMFPFLLGFLAGLILFYKGFFTLRKKRKIEHTPTSKIRSLALGDVEISGQAIAGPRHNEKDSVENSISPLTKKRCVYYRTLIEEERNDGKKHHWVEIHRKEYKHPFFVKDDTGRVIVDPAGAQIHVPVDFEEVSGFGRDPSAAVQEYLKSCDIKYETIFGMNKKMRFTENIIAEGDSVYVYGNAMPSGKLSSVGSENILVGKKRGELFFISDRAEKDVLKYLSRYMYFEIYGGALISTISLAIFLARLY